MSILNSLRGKINYVYLHNFKSTAAIVVKFFADLFQVYGFSQDHCIRQKEAR
jgi:hypothetical protein